MVACRSRYDLYDIIRRPELYPYIEYGSPPEADSEMGLATGVQTIGGAVQSVYIRYQAMPARSASIRFHGLTGSAQQETIDRLRLAENEVWPDLSDVIFYIAPAGTEVTPLLDMAYLAAVIAKGPTFYLFCGEINEDGCFCPLNAPLAVGKIAKDKDQTVVVPKASAELVALAGASVIGVQDAEELRVAIDGGAEQVKATDYNAVSNIDYPPGDDLGVIKGQVKAKVALEIAVAGGHNLLLVGPPGEGKSALASRAYTIMPQLSLDEAIEVTELWHTAGRADARDLLTIPPFVVATKNTSPTGLRGGGDITGARPGLASLAHKGILFADELFEWARSKIDSLRIPLQDKEIVISRRDWQVTFPADFQLIASANPCPCGYWGHPEHSCECHENKDGYSSARVRYVRKMSGPIMDRIDLKCWMPPLLDAAFDEPAGETSSVIRQRVIAARVIQQQRYANVSITRNAELGPGLFEKLCNETNGAMDVLKSARGRLGLSTRGIDKLRGVARTCADLRQSEYVEADDVVRGQEFMGIALPTK